MIVLFASGSTWLAYKISRQTSVLYARAMGWFSITMELIAFFMLFTVMPQVYVVGKIAGNLFYATAVEFSIAGILMIISAFMFKRSSRGSSQA
jgi:hypothetical protein